VKWGKRQHDYLTNQHLPSESKLSSVHKDQQGQRVIYTRVELGISQTDNRFSSPVQQNDSQQ
jgi:hypothetical protein